MKLSDVMSAAHGLSAYAEVALVIFLGVFLGVVLDLFCSGRRNAELERLPLEDDLQPAQARLAPREQP
jgi:hypothetical protein